MERKFIAHLYIEKEKKVIKLEPVVSFSKDENTYGNGYYMRIDNAGLGFMNAFDCRYDKRLHEKDLSEYAIRFMMEDLWTGENGSAKCFKVEELIHG